MAIEDMWGTCSGSLAKVTSATEGDLYPAVTYTHAVTYTNLEDVRTWHLASLKFQEGIEPGSTHEETSDKPQVSDSHKNNWPLIFKNSKVMRVAAPMADCRKQRSGSDEGSLNSYQKCLSMSNSFHLKDLDQHSKNY
jgi:hypothetical protein